MPVQKKICELCGGSSSSFFNVKPTQQKIDDKNSALAKEEHFVSNLKLIAESVLVAAMETREKRSHRSDLKMRIKYLKKKVQAKREELAVIEGQKERQIQSFRTRSASAFCIASDESRLSIAAGNAEEEAVDKFWEKFQKQSGSGSEAEAGRGCDRTPNLMTSEPLSHLKESIVKNLAQLISVLVLDIFQVEMVDQPTYSAHLETLRLRKIMGNRLPQDLRWNSVQEMVDRFGVGREECKKGLWFFARLLEAMYGILELASPVKVVSSSEGADFKVSIESRRKGSQEGEIALFSYDGVTALSHAADEFIEAYSGW
eukprot:CAMPEP_0113872152 /NCGR_PEP_ID=MMETSP0780_2-20120614/3039_1 /TAXON_ID=652834 /ORGANISM="Palpitomonas bilix" /LENGTH=314 /DNA_ID=CAMNT_0000857621 /DNA_START=214 /DNA_END=1156 /DNA_ORIENTATION=+ /assembly_acc=CAM_ASM_000599